MLTFKLVTECASNPDTWNIQEIKRGGLKFLDQKQQNLGRSIFFFLNGVCQDSLALAKLKRAAHESALEVKSFSSHLKMSSDKNPDEKESLSRIANAAQKGLEYFETLDNWPELKPFENGLNFITYSSFLLMFPMTALCVIADRTMPRSISNYVTISTCALINCSILTMVTREFFARYSSIGKWIPEVSKTIKASKLFIHELDTCAEDLKLPRFGHRFPILISFPSLGLYNQFLPPLSF